MSSSANLLTTYTPRRSWWHPYADDTSPIDVTGINEWRDMAARVPSLIGQQNTPGIGLLWHALRIGKPYHSPQFGCIFHEYCI